MSKIKYVFLVLVLLIAGCSSDDERKEEFEESFHTTNVLIESLEMDFILVAADIVRDDIKDPKLTVDYMRVGTEDITDYTIYYNYEEKYYGAKVNIHNEKHLGYTLSVGVTYTRIFWW